MAKKRGAAEPEPVRLQRRLAIVAEAIRSHETALPPLYAERRDLFEALQAGGLSTRAIGALAGVSGVAVVRALAARRVRVRVRVER